MGVALLAALVLAVVEWTKRPVLGDTIFPLGSFVWLVCVRASLSSVIVVKAAVEDRLED